MTKTMQGQDFTQHSVSNKSGDKCASSIVQNPSQFIRTASSSDNETSEKPIREKLKKTSIASIPRNDLSNLRDDDTSESVLKVDRAESSQNFRQDQMSVDKFAEIVNGGRGRSLRKRSFEDLDTGADNCAFLDELLYENPSLHTRKRSRDVRVDSGQKAQHSSPRISAIAVQGSTQKTTQTHRDHADLIQYAGAIKEIAPVSDTSSAEQETNDSILSPRKKRSRDQLDSDTDREQKIVATEETKALRRSEENERDGPSRTIDDGAREEPTSVLQGELLAENPGLAIDELRSLKKRPLKGFGDVSIISPIATSESGSYQLIPRIPYSLSNQHNSTAQNESVASSFADYSRLMSPFGIIGVGPTVNNRDTSDGFDLSRLSPEVSQSFEGKTNMVESSSSTIMFSSDLLDLKTMSTSTNDSYRASKFSSFRNSSFGGGFGTAFNGRTPLSSFAAPVGDANWGDRAGLIGNFATPNNQEEENGDSDSDDCLGEVAKDDETSKVDGRFQQQDGKCAMIRLWFQSISNIQKVETGEDGEESIFSSSRVNLYSWNGSAWKEGGRGTFKLNVAVPHLDDGNCAQKSGRFIMRAHQTFRVLLNVSIFKQMKIGDSKGNEPTGKSLSFSVIENGKPTPYLIKMSDEGESKTLYQAVKKLQQEL